MSEFLGYLERLKARPNPDELSESERAYLAQHFDPFSGEVIIDGTSIRWDYLDEVEAVKAARAAGPSGWLVRAVMGDDRYHVGLYYGKQEAVLPNVSLAIARYVVQTVAFYAPHPVRYKGIEGLSPIANA
jgi:hypothetical protein